MMKAFPKLKGVMEYEFTQNKKYFVGRVMDMKCAPWSIANFCLIGDAAHTQGYIPGYGLNAGLEDCEILVDMIKQK